MSLFRVLVFSVFTVAVVDGDTVLSIDLDTNTPGIQSRRDVKAGDTFDVDLLMEITDSSSVSIYSFGVSFDNSELMMSNAVDVSGRGSGFGQISLQIAVENTKGTLHPLDLFSLTDALESPFSGRIARMTVTATNPVNDASADLTPTLLRSGDGFVSRQNASIPLGVTRGDGGVFFNGGTLNATAVPEPSAFLFVALMTGAWGFKRRLRSLDR